MELASQIPGTIFDVQGFSVHDGPGARSLIFLKGCTLNCFWCSNPEGIGIKNVPLYYASNCIDCGKCMDNCPVGAIRITREGHFIDRSLCMDCTDHQCVVECYTDALRFSGRKTTVDELYKVIQRDRPFWGSGGGITLTGGEPLFQIDFARAILEKCYDAYIHTAIETCGNVPWKNFEKVIEFLDWIFFDLKQMDTELHKGGTGASNEVITDNVMKLSGKFNGRVIFRLPLIPGFNDSDENFERIAALILKTKWREINILPLHHLGREKYESLGREYKGLSYPIPSKDKLLEVKSVFESKGITCYIGHETPF
ncbi:MAG: glycyl-radical enzyme activating protein [Bacteroidales bacterium]|nr:glycyl-radical enzyme activating protein [Bacteroidales bacterium]